LWTARNSGIESYIERIAYAAGRWVGVAEHGGLTTSSDGINWTGSSTGPPLSDHEGVAYGNGLWVVAGGYFLNPDRETRAVGTIYTSTDTLTWTRREADRGKRWRDVTFGRGKFVVVGNDGSMSFSTNGVFWQPLRFIANLNLRRVHYANGRFVAVGNDGNLISSADPADGLPWTKHRTHSSQNLHDVYAAPDGTFIYVGNNGMALQSGDTRPRFLSIDYNGRLEFDAGIAGRLRLERSSDLHTWQIEAVNVTSPHIGTGGGGSAFWRLADD